MPERWSLSWGQCTTSVLGGMARYARLIFSHSGQRGSANHMDIQVNFGHFANGDISIAQQVIRNAITDVSTARATIGSFQKYSVGSSLAGIQVGIQNLTAANSVIRDTDYASEIASLNRSMVLQQASMKAIRIMMSTRSSILELLG